MENCFSDYVRSLIIELLENIDVYFSYDILNSEGRKIFSRLAYEILKSRPEYKKYIGRVWRKPTLNNVLKVAELILGEELYKVYMKNYVQF